MDELTQDIKARGGNLSYENARNIANHIEALITARVVEELRAVLSTITPRMDYPEALGEVMGNIEDRIATLQKGDK